MEEYELGFYNFLKLIVKVLAIISLTPICLSIIHFIDADFLKTYPFAFIPVVLITLILVFLNVKPKNLIDKFHFTQEGIQGVKNEMIKWSQIKSFYWKSNIKGGGYHIKMRLINNQTYHFTPSTWESENLSKFFKRFKELKPNDIDILTNT